MANEQNEQAQDIQHEQAEQSNEQTQAEGVSKQTTLPLNLYKHKSPN